MKTTKQTIVESFEQIELALQEIRHSYNAVEITEAYKKLRELGLWISLAASIEKVEKPFQNKQEERPSVNFDSQKSKKNIAKTK